MTQKKASPERPAIETHRKGTQIIAKAILLVCYFFIGFCIGIIIMKGLIL